MNREDDYVKASPANRRAILETVAALEEKGHECIEFQVPQRKHLKRLEMLSHLHYIIFQHHVLWNSLLVLPLLMDTKGLLRTWDLTLRYIFLFISCLAHC